jgi:hypothetical protein
MGAGRTVVRRQARRRWGIVLAAVVLLCSAPVLVQVWPARAAPVEPAVLRARIAASAAQPYEGFAQSAGLLPLPPLPNLGQVTALVSTTTQLRTWYAGPRRWRVDVVDGGAERDVYQTPDAQYVWDYGADQLTKILGAQPVRLPRAADLTPPDLARRLVAMAAGDRFERLGARRVAGVTAPGLRIVPATADTTVAHVDVWAEPRSGLPLQVEVTARGGQRPVFVTRFLQVRRTVPGAAVLTPPAVGPGVGFGVTTAPDVLGAVDRRLPPGLLPASLAGSPRRDAFAGVSVLGVYGTGLAQFVAIGLPGRFGWSAYEQVARYGTALTVPGGDAALLATGLLSVLAVRCDRTYLVAGLVQPAVLRRVAAELAGDHP